MTLTTQQLALRRTGIGSSDIGALVGLSPWASPIDVWLSKTGRGADLASTIPMRIGNALEPLIAELYAERTGAKLSEPAQTHVHAVDSWRLATPDRVAHFGAASKVVECKNATFGGSEWGEEGTDDVPPQYICQVQWQLDVLGLEEADVAALVGMKLRVYHVRRDEGLCGQLREAAAAFWRDHVIADVQPPLDGSEGTKAYLARKHPVNTGDFIAATTADDAIAEELAAVKGALDATEERANTLMNQLRARIGDHDGVQGADWKATWKRAKDGRKTDWQAVCRELGAPAHLIEKHSKPTEGSRRFLFAPPTSD